MFDVRPEISKLLDCIYRDPSTWEFDSSRPWVENTSTKLTISLHGYRIWAGREWLPTSFAEKWQLRKAVKFLKVFTRQAKLIANANRLTSKVDDLNNAL